MDYVVVIDGRSAVGAWLLQLNGKIGGSNFVLQQGGATHAVVIATDLDMSTAPAFVQMTHIQDPGAPNRQPRQFVIPAAAMLGAWPAGPAAGQPPQQAASSSPLH